MTAAMRTLPTSMKGLAQYALDQHAILKQEEDWGDGFKELFIRTREALETVVNLPEDICSVETLVAWNYALRESNEVSDTFLNAATFEVSDFTAFDEFDEVLAVLDEAVRKGVLDACGPDALEAVATQALWASLTDGARLDFFNSRDPRLPQAQMFAKAVLEGPEVVVRLGPTTRPDVLLEALGFDARSKVLKVPAGLLSAVGKDIRDFVLVPVGTEDVERRLEALQTLVADDGASLADLWSATEQL